MPPATATLMVGFQVAELSPVMPVAVTPAMAAVRSGGSFAVNVAVPTLVMGPATYPTDAAPIVGPALGVKAVEMTLATQPEPAAALRASLTWTWPRGPLMTPPATVLAMLPRLPALPGTVMASAPPVTVTVAVVGPAAAGPAMPSVNMAATIATGIRRMGLILMVFRSPRRADWMESAEGDARRTRGREVLTRRNLACMERR